MQSIYEKIDNITNGILAIFWIFFFAALLIDTLFSIYKMFVKYKNRRKSRRF